MLRPAPPKGPADWIQLNASASALADPVPDSTSSKAQATACCFFLPTFFFMHQATLLGWSPSLLGWRPLLLVTRSIHPSHLRVSPSRSSGSLRTSCTVDGKCRLVPPGESYPMEKDNVMVFPVCQL